LDDLVRDPARAGLLSSEERQALLAQAASVLVVLASSGVTGDRLLTVKDAAHKLKPRRCQRVMEPCSLSSRIQSNLR